MLIINILCGSIFICIFLLLFLKFFPRKQIPIEKKISKNIDTFVANVQEHQLTPENHFVLADLYHYGKYGRAKSLNLAIHEYDKVIKFSNDRSLLAKAYFSKAKIYEETTNKDVSNILDNYVKAFENGMEESILIIGKIYMHGLHPHYLADKLIASKIFTMFLNFSPSLHAWCNYYLKEIQFDLSYTDLDTIPQNNQSVKYLPENIIHTLNNAIRFIKTNQIEMIKYSSVLDRDELKKFEISDDEPEFVFNNLPKNIVTNDTQNVHDHSLQNIGKQIIDIIDSRNEVKEDDFSNNFRALLKKVPNESKEAFERVCKSFSTVHHSRYEKSERDVFNLVHNKIKENEDAKIIFIDNILSCIENELIVCSTGKIMRLLSTLDVIDSETPTLKPEWVIKNEISQTISKTINDLSASQKSKYNSDDNEQIVNLIQTKVKNKCTTDYKDVLDPAILDIYLNDYFQYL